MSERNIKLLVKRYIATVNNTPKRQAEQLAEARVVLAHENHRRRGRINTRMRRVLVDLRQRMATGRYSVIVFKVSR